MERNFEEEARQQGWAPQEDWKGDPEKWKTAQQFVEDGENSLPIFKSRVEKEIAELREKLDESKQANQQFGQFFEDYKSRQEKENSKLREQLEATKKQAIDDGDGEAFLRAEKQLQEIEPIPPKLTPEQQAWLSSNSWYGKDRGLTRDADMVSEDLVKEGYVDQSPAYFKELTRRVRETNPDAFENKNRARASSVETDVSETVTSKKPSYDNLPPDAKKACDEFVKQGLFKSPEEYVKAYDWETENA